MDIIERAAKVFRDKNFKVQIATPKTAQSFCELYKNEDKEAIKEVLENAIDVNYLRQVKYKIGKKDKITNVFNQIKEDNEHRENKERHQDNHQDKEVHSIMNRFKELDQQLDSAKLKAHYAYINYA